MKIRALEPSDIDEIRKIHHEFYRDEFEFPDFLHNFVCAFVVTDDEGKIISAGGVKLIAESIIVTDKNFPVKDRRTALYNVLDASEFITKRANFSELHAFIQDDDWYYQLQRVGFLPTRGKPLVLELR